MDHVISDDKVVSPLDCGVVLCSLVPTETVPKSSWVSAEATRRTPSPFANIQLWIRRSTRKLHCPTPVQNQSLVSAFLTISRGQLTPWCVASWGDWQFSPQKHHKTAGNYVSNGTASVCVPIKMRDDGTRLGQHSPSLPALGSVESLKGLLDSHALSWTVLPAERQSNELLPSGFLTCYPFFSPDL